MLLKQSANPIVMDLLLSHCRTPHLALARAPEVTFTTWYQAAVRLYQERRISLARYNRIVIDVREAKHLQDAQVLTRSAGCYDFLDIPVGRTAVVIGRAAYLNAYKAAMHFAKTHPPLRFSGRILKSGRGGTLTRLR